MLTTEYKVQAVWSIENKTFLNKKDIESEEFETALPNVQYSITLTPVDDERKGYSSIRIYEPENSTIKEMKLLIPSANFEEELLFDFGDYVAFIKREDILDPKKNFFVDDLLTLEIRGILSCETPKLNVGKYLWDDNDGKDFTFIVGKEKIMAHKLVIRQYSSVLAAAIDSKKSEIKIENFQKNIVKEALGLCYGDVFRCRISIYHYFKVIEFAVIYDMPLIKEQAEYKLAELIDGETICELANESIELKAEILRGFCVKFLCDYIKDGKPYDENFADLNPQILALVFRNSCGQTQIS